MAAFWFGDWVVFEKKKKWNKNASLNTEVRLGHTEAGLQQDEHVTEMKH